MQPSTSTPPVPASGPKSTDFSAESQLPSVSGSQRSDRRTPAPKPIERTGPATAAASRSAPDEDALALVPRYPNSFTLTDLAAAMSKRSFQKFKIPRFETSKTIYPDGNPALISMMESSKCAAQLHHRLPADDETLKACIYTLCAHALAAAEKATSVIFNPIVYGAAVTVACGFIPLVLCEFVPITVPMEGDSRWKIAGEGAEATASTINWATGRGDVFAAYSAMFAKDLSAGLMLTSLAGTLSGHVSRFAFLASPYATTSYPKEDDDRKKKHRMNQDAVFSEANIAKVFAAGGPVLGACTITLVKAIDFSSLPWHVIKQAHVLIALYFASDMITSGPEDLSANMDKCYGKIHKPNKDAGDFEEDDVRDAAFCRVRTPGGEGHSLAEAMADYFLLAQTGSGTHYDKMMCWYSPEISRRLGFAEVLKNAGAFGLYFYGREYFTRCAALARILSSEVELVNIALRDLEMSPSCSYNPKRFTDLLATAIPFLSSAVALVFGAVQAYTTIQAADREVKLPPIGTLMSVSAPFISKIIPIDFVVVETVAIALPRISRAAAKRMESDSGADILKVHGGEDEFNNAQKALMDMH